MGPIKEPNDGKKWTSQVIQDVDFFFAVAFTMDFVDLISLFIILSKNMLLYRGGPWLLTFFYMMKQLMQRRFHLHITSATLSTSVHA